MRRVWFGLWVWILAVPLGVAAEQAADGASEPVSTAAPTPTPEAPPSTAPAGAPDATAAPEAPAAPAAPAATAAPGTPDSIAAPTTPASAAEGPGGSTMPAAAEAAGAQEADETSAANVESGEGQEDADEPDAKDTAASSVENRQGGELRILVVGSRDRAATLPGSAHYLSKEDLEKQGNTDVHRALRTVPGVNLQEEDGYGLRPNIGMRGTGVERSAKITVMEDGVLAAPAPYSAPSAYYFPIVGRMEAIEVRKGSAQIKYGPFTNGGALNLVSRSIPERLSGTARAFAGEDSTRGIHAFVGDSYQNVGWLAEGFIFGSDGFKLIDGGGDTGFDIKDVVAKVRFNTSPAARFYQAVEVKAGVTDEVSNETYLGLSEADFGLNPYRRYAGSQRDRMKAEHSQVRARHFIQIAPTLDITTTLYRNDFQRNWYKLDRVGGEKIADVLADPSAYPTEYGSLTGLAGADLDVKANNREYYSHGAETILGWVFGAGPTTHELEVGARYHEDAEDRFQHVDTYTISDGAMTLSVPGVAGTGSSNNRIGTARAFAAFAQDGVTWRNLTLSGGLRFENIDLEREDYGADDAERTGTDLTVSRSHVSVVLPGAGVSWAVDPKLRVFAGVHRGFSPPGPGSDDQTEAETSTNYEVGARYQLKGLRTTLVTFYSDYDNLLGADTASAGGQGSGDLFNGGAVDVVGVEAELSTDIAQLFYFTGFQLPISVAYTYTQGRFQSSFDSSFDEWGTVVEGDHLPYLPPHQVSARIGVEAPLGGFELSGTYMDAMRTRPGQGAIPAGEGTDAHFVMDVTGRVFVTTRSTLFLTVRNLTDETYVVARRPAGLRPGLPRRALAGVKVTF